MPREVSDGDLVASARDGDGAAFEALVTRHADQLHATVLRLVGSHHEAREITQEAFLRAWRGLAQFQGQAAFSTWLYRIALNETKRAHSRRQRRVGLAARSLDDLAFEPADPGKGPAGHTEQRELAAALGQAVAALPLKYRAPLVLRDIEGLSTQEAAAILDIGEAAFKSRLHRARMRVRVAVKDLL